MSKKNKNKNVNADTDVDAEVQVDGNTEASSGRTVIVTLEDGTKMSRKDYCIKRANEGAQRSTIAKELSILEGKPVAHQAVFAATKDHPTYPKRGDVKPADITDETEATIEADITDETDEVEAAQY